MFHYVGPRLRSYLKPPVNRYDILLYHRCYYRYLLTLSLYHKRATVPLQMITTISSLLAHNQIPARILTSSLLSVICGIGSRQSLTRPLTPRSVKYDTSDTSENSLTNLISLRCFCHLFPPPLF